MSTSETPITEAPTTETSSSASAAAPAPRQRIQWSDKPLTKDDNPGGLLEESSFATLFPKYREKYLQESWPEVTRALKDSLGVRCELDLVEGSMTVRTTKKTYDPYAILKARDIIKMLSRGVPVKQALRATNDDVFCDVIKISGYVQNKEKFVRRRQRLVGPNGATLKAIELLTGCYVLVQGKTVSVMGPYKGLRIVKQIVEDCMNNIHPVYNIKTYMIKKELEKDPSIVGEDYDRFIPKFKKNVVKPKQKKPKKEKKKKIYTPFPPPMPLSKIDKQVESGEYFLSKQAKEANKAAARAEQQKAAALKRKMEKAKSFVPPKEPAAKPKKAEAKEESVEDLKKRVIEQSKAAAKRAAEKSRDAESYIIPAKRAKKN